MTIKKSHVIIVLHEKKGAKKELKLSENQAVKFRFHNDFLLLRLGFLSAVEYNYLICILHKIKNKGVDRLEFSSYSLRQNIAKKYLNYRYNSCMFSLRDKLKEHGFIGNNRDALFSGFDFIVANGRIKSLVVKISENRAYLINNVKNNYTTIDLGALQYLSTFTAKALYCWYCSYNKRDYFLVKIGVAKDCLGINIHSTTADALKIKNALTDLKKVGMYLSVSKQKNNFDSRVVFSLVFSKNNDTKPIQVDTATPPTKQATDHRNLDSLIHLTYKKDDKLVRLARIDKNGAYYKAWFEYVDKQGGFFVPIKDYDYFMDYLAVNGFIRQDKANEVDTNKTNQSKRSALLKENDALTRFKNSIKTLNNANPNPTITPTIKNANNKQTQANNEILNKFENIVLTSPKHFDYKIISVTKGSLYYEIKAYCDLKKKHELTKLLVGEYSNPLDYFFKQGYKFKRYDNKESDTGFEKYIYKIVSLCNSDEKYGDIVSYLKIMRIFKRYDDKIQVELKDADKEGVVIKPFIADNSAHLNAWFNKYQFGSY